MPHKQNVLIFLLASLASHLKQNFNRYIAKHAQNMTFTSTANTFNAF